MRPVPQPDNSGSSDGRFPPSPPAGRERAFNLPGVVIAFIAVCVGIHLVRSYLLTTEQDFWVILHFAFIPLRYSGLYALDIYAFTGPWSYSLLHGGLAHLAVNMIWLAAFGSPLANRIGTGRFVAFWLVTSLAAVGLHYVLHIDEAVPLVGASGAISGMMGAAARFGFRVDRQAPKPSFEGALLSIPEVFRSRTVMTFLGVWMVVNFAAGYGSATSDSGSSIAWEAHIGGFLAGFLLIRLFDRNRLQLHRY